jgi:hypothetical protein
VKTIWKFEIPIADEFAIEMPAGTELLSVQAQGGTDPVLWALVDDKAPMARRGFALRGTGHEADGLTKGDYVGTFQVHGGRLVFHLFAIGESSS